MLLYKDILSLELHSESYLTLTKFTNWFNAFEGTANAGTSGVSAPNRRESLLSSVLAAGVEGLGLFSKQNEISVDNERSIVKMFCVLLIRYLGRYTIVDTIEFKPKERLRECLEHGTNYAGKTRRQVWEARCEEFQPIY